MSKTLDRTINLIEALEQLTINKNLCRCLNSEELCMDLRF